LGNLYVFEDRRWLDNPNGYYSRTTQYRFLAISSLARAFEREAFFIDSRIAEPRDFDFLRFIKAFLWATTSVELFRGLPYDETNSTDHFFADQIRQLCDEFCPSPDKTLSFSEFERRVGEGETFDAVVEFFHGLHSSETRLRWDRLVALNLLLIAFLGTVGYTTHQTSIPELLEVAKKIRYPEVRANFIRRLSKLGLANQPQMKLVTAALESAGLPEE